MDLTDFDQLADYYIVNLKTISAEELIKWDCYLVTYAKTHNIQFKNAPRETMVLAKDIPEDDLIMLKLRGCDVLTKVTQRVIDEMKNDKVNFDFKIKSMTVSDPDTLEACLAIIRS